MQLHAQSVRLLLNSMATAFASPVVLTSSLTKNSWPAVSVLRTAKNAQVPIIAQHAAHLLSPRMDNVLPVQRALTLTQSIRSAAHAAQTA